MRFLAVALLLALAPHFTGCAAILRGTSQQTRINTRPEGGSFEYEYLRFRDGDVVTIRKKFKPAMVNVGTERRPIDQELQYYPDAWLIGDCVLLLVFVIPGLIALGVDFGTGAWRNYDQTQFVRVPD